MSGEQPPVPSVYVSDDGIARKEKREHCFLVYSPLSSIGRIGPEATIFPTRPISAMALGHVLQAQWFST